MDTYNYSLEFLKDSNLTDFDKFELFYKLMNDPNNVYLDSRHEYYEHIKNLSEEQIDKISKLKINGYLFFRYLPNVNLIKKYYVNDSNKFHGITKNDNITREERQMLIGNILQNKIN